MRSLPVMQVDAFTRRPFEGNPAGVIPSAEGLSAQEMQQVAREMNCSETAFVLQADTGDIRLRYFTPAVEVDLCGHATVASLHALREAGRISGELRVQTNVGVLQMEARADGSCWMAQDRPAFRELGEDPKIIAGLLGLPVSGLSREIAVGIAYTGLWALLVPVKDLDTLRSACPNHQMLAEHNRRLGVVSTHLYCFETVQEESTLHARDFSPAAGVPEDPHTGTASGALGAYLVAKGALRPGLHAFEQGWSVGRPGRILVEVAQGASAVRVGGQAVTVLEGTIQLQDGG